MSKFLIQKIHTVRSTFHSLLPSIFSKAQQLQFKLITGANDKKIAKIGSKIELPRNKYPNLEQYLQMFCNSVAQNGRPNGQNLLFVTGMEGSGKTTLIKQALELFRKRKAVFNVNDRKKVKRNREQQQVLTVFSTPEYLEDLQRRQKLSNGYCCVLEFDFNEKTMMKPQAFFHTLQTSIIQKLIQLNKQIKQKSNEDLFTPEILVSITTSENAPQYVYMFVKDFIWSVVNKCDTITISDKGINSLESILDSIPDMTAGQFFGISIQRSQVKSNGELEEKISKEQQKSKSKIRSCFMEIVGIIAKEKKWTELEAAFRIFLGAFKRIQYQHRPQLYLNRQYETGVETTKFLFSVLNYICGFGNLNKQTLRSHIQSSNQPLPKSPSRRLPTLIESGTHIDTILTFHHLHNISCFHHPKFQNWLDTLLIQVHNSSNIRTHFPIIIQLNDSYILEKLQKFGRMEIDNPTVMEIPGYFQTNLYRYMPGLIVNKRVVKRLRAVLGRNPSLWNQAFVQLSKGIHLEHIISGTCQFMQKSKTKLQNRLNRLYLNPQNLPLIDNKTLNLHLLQYLHIISKCNGHMRTKNIQYNLQILNNPLFSQLYSLNILYDYYYFLSVSLTDMRDLIHIRNMLTIHNLGLRKWVEFWVWRRVKSPYCYWMRELRYNDDIEVQIRKRDSIQNQTSEFMLREYYGETKDYKATYYSRFLKQRLNI